MISNDRLKEIREYCAKATPGPWFYNSYSAIFSGAEGAQAAEDKLWDEYIAAGEPKGPYDKPVEPWRSKLYDADTSVAHVPAIAGDTAAHRHGCDAIFIAEARQDLPALVEELEKCRKALRQITELSQDLEYYGPGDSPEQSMRRIARESLPIELEGT